MAFDMRQDFSADAQYMVLQFLKAFLPHRVEGKQKIRVGQFFAGGYVMLDDFEGVSGAYSLGIDGDVSWDLDIAARGIPVFQYDHTINQLPAEHELFTWKKIGIANRTDAERRMTSIPDAIRANGHEGCNDLILKCDIEGYEWDVLAEIPNVHLRQFRQVILELHGLEYMQNFKSAENARRAMNNLMASHRLIHVHGNNFAPWAVVGGVPVPQMIEVTFARTDSGNMVVSDEIFPTHLDTPCNPAEADMYLGRFSFE